MIGRIVSGSAVPTAASTLPTAPSDRPKPSPIHSTPFVNSSAPARITTSDRASSSHSMGRGIVPLRRDPASATLPPSKGSGPEADLAVITADRPGGSLAARGRDLRPYRLRRHRDHAEGGAPGHPPI